MAAAEDIPLAGPFDIGGNAGKALVEELFAQLAAKCVNVIGIVHAGNYQVSFDIDISVDPKVKP